MIVQKRSLSHLLLGLIVFAEEAYTEGWQEEEAGPEVHPGLHPPCRGWHHGRCQLCTYTGRSVMQCKYIRDLFMLWSLVKKA